MGQIILGFIIIFIGIFLYLLPTIVACGREHKNSGGIFILNLFLGRTLLGWIGALIWALSND